MAQVLLQSTNAAVEEAETEEADIFSRLQYTLASRRRSTLIERSKLRAQVLEDASSQLEAETLEVMRRQNQQSFRTRVLRTLFRVYASWTTDANANFMSRTRFRQCVRDLHLPKTKARLGSIDLVFEAAHNLSRGNHARNLLTFSQFVSALSLLALRVYGKVDLFHLDPRLVTREGGRRHRAFEQMYRVHLVPLATAHGAAESDAAGTHRRTGQSFNPVAHAASATASSRSDSITAVPVPQTQLESEEITAARDILLGDRSALHGIFIWFAGTERCNQIPAALDARMSFSELSKFARLFDLIPDVCSQSQLLLIFRRFRLREPSAQARANAGANPAIVSFDGFVNVLVWIATRHMGRMFSGRSIEHDSRLVDTEGHSSEGGNSVAGGSTPTIEVVQAQQRALHLLLRMQRSPGLVTLMRSRRKRGGLVRFRVREK